MICDLFVFLFLYRHGGLRAAISYCAEDARMGYRIVLRDMDSPLCAVKKDGGSQAAMTDYLARHTKKSRRGGTE